MKASSFYVMISILSLFPFFSCDHVQKESTLISPPIVVKTKAIVDGNIQNQITLNGKSIYLKKSAVLAPISGYVEAVHIQYGEYVKDNQELYVLQTKEGVALKNSIGSISIKAFSAGTIVDLQVNSKGSFVSEGQSLCSIVQNKDVMVQVNVPYQYNSLVKKNKKCTIILPDQTVLEAQVYKVLPMVDAKSQTQNVLIQVQGGILLPENLNLSVQFVLDQHFNTMIIDKNAVMSNEAQDAFWIMKIVDDSLAIKVPVEVGIKNDSLIEIYSSDLKVSDLIISEGAYGLEDSSIVKTN